MEHDRSPVFALNFPRALALDNASLVRVMPDYAMNVIVSRLMFDNALGFLCFKTGGNAPALDEVPLEIDYGPCRRLEIRQTENDMRVCLCDDTRLHNVLYQTSITRKAWKENKDLVFHAAGKLQQALVLKP